MSLFQLKAEEYEAIKKAEKETRDKNISRRLRILMLRYEGHKVREIAELTGMRINSIDMWLIVYAIPFAICPTIGAKASL